MTLAVDLSICDQEPIARLERIQSFGFLLAMTRGWMITRASANLGLFLGVEAEAVLGSEIDKFIDREALHEIRNRMTGLAVTGLVERVYGMSLVAGPALYDIAIHVVGDAYVLEGEWAGPDSRMDAAALVRKMVARLKTLPTLSALHADAARQVRSLTGFDRILIYQFAADGAGQVVAEVAGAGRDSFLGLHYPASDIPAQARALYLRNPFRIIADVQADTVTLLPTASRSQDTLDLSLALTRAVSPVHIEYLTNLQVAASLSISIIVEGKLWGLIACHHQKPKLPSFVARAAVELFGQMYSMNLETRLKEAAEAQEQEGREAVVRMRQAIGEDAALLEDAEWLQSVMVDLMHCDGVAVVGEDWIHGSGAVPPDAAIQSLTRLCDHSVRGALFSSSSLSSLQPQVFDSAAATAGVLCIPLARSPLKYLMLFRREHVHEVRWAGEPSKAITLREGATRLSPRKSFAEFVESIRGRSRPFSDADLKFAGLVRSELNQGSGLLAGTSGRSDPNARQELLIAELNHRVRNVLALIRGLISQTRGQGEGVAGYVESLNGRVQALARAHDKITRHEWGPGRLNELFDDEIGAHVPARADRLTITGPTVYLQPQAYSTMALVVHELVTNSCKYGALSTDGRVEVTLAVSVETGLTFSWVESGGPVVTEPTRRGFGSIVLERVVPFDLQGAAGLLYAPAGLQATFCIPPRYLATGPLNDESVIGEPVLESTRIQRLPDTLLQDRHVLLLEDNLIVALAAEEILLSLGAVSVFAISSIEGAISHCDSHTIGFAVLDFNLGDANSIEVAARLREAGIPFVFASGYGQQWAWGDGRQAELSVSKPYDRESLGTAISLTLAGQQAGVL